MLVLVGGAATAMTAVAVQASAPLTRAGAVSKVFTFLRDVRTRARRESPPRCVIVTDQVQSE